MLLMSVFRFCFCFQGKAGTPLTDQQGLLVIVEQSNKIIVTVPKDRSQLFWFLTLTTVQVKEANQKMAVQQVQIFS